MIRKATVCLLMAMASLGMANGQDSGQLDVTDPRPLMAAADSLQQTARVAISYEDPPFVFSGDILDITDEIQSPRQRAANPNAKILVPRGGRIVNPLPPLRSGEAADAAVALTLARQAQEGSGLPGRFKVEQVGTAVVIEPVSVRNAAGDWERVSSALSTSISFPFARRSGADTLSLILSNVKKSDGPRIDVAALPVSLFANTYVAMGATEETAKSKLLSLFEQLTKNSVQRASGSLLSYRLLFDPGLRYYLLSVKPVPAPDLSATEERPASPAQMQGFGYKEVPVN